MEYYHVFYHYPCNDGELSRVIWEYFKPNSSFYKWIHQNDHENEINIINNLPDKSNVVFLDLTPNIIDKLSNKHNYIIIDHHKNPILTLIGNKKNLPNYNILLYVQKGFLSGNPDNNNLSGCKLTWHYFSKENYPSVVYYIGSKDVWDFSNPNTEKYCQGFNHHIKDLNDSSKYSFINELLNNNDNDDNFILFGEKIIEEYKIQASNIFTNNTININIETINNINYNIVDINVNNIINNITIYKYLIEFAQDNFHDTDVLRILHTETNDKLCYSLRSLKDNIKVDEIARFYGGNGHEKAAGYTIFK